MDLDIKNSRVLVAGLGISGQSVVEALRNRASSVLSVDEKNPQADLRSFDNIDFGQIDLVVVSPVFRPDSSFIQQAQRLRIPVISEVEMAWHLRTPNARTGRPAPWIGITGTNGKTSTTQMTSAIMAASGWDAPTVGNIGKAVSRAVLDSTHDALCVELSSFQLHFTYSLELECAAIINIAADHLDWHGGFDEYVADKAKIYQGVTKVLVYNADDEQVSAIAEAAQVSQHCRKVGFTLGQPTQGLIGIDDGWIVDMSGVAADPTGQAEKIMPLSELRGLSEPNGTIYPHLLADTLCALSLALGAGASREAACQAMKNFKPGDHRIEVIAQLGQTPESIRFVDDSKATNAHAAQASLSSYPPDSIVWVAGGLTKGGHFEQLVENQRSRLAAVVVIGKDAKEIMDALANKAPNIPVTRIDPEPEYTVMQRAVDAAGSYAKPGQTVLLAPACASMDQFKSYADRGAQFALAAQQWVNEHENH